MRLILMFSAFVIAITIADVPSAEAQSGPAMCLKTCIETYGADKKQACALQCGYGKNLGTGGGQQRDCGTIYKQCMRACGGDNACKNSCRKQRTSCY